MRVVGPLLVTMALLGLAAVIILPTPVQTDSRIRQHLLSLGIQILAAVVAAALLWPPGGVHRAADRERVVWQRLSITSFLWAIGLLVYGMREWRGPGPPYPSVADILFVAASLILIGGLLRELRLVRPRLTAWLGLLIAGLTTGMVVGTMAVLLKSVMVTPTDLAEKGLDLAYPAIALFQISLIVVPPLALSGSLTGRTWLGVAIGVACLCLSMIGFVVLASFDLYSDVHPINLLRVAGFAVLAGTGAWRRQSIASIVAENARLSQPREARVFTDLRIRIGKLWRVWISGMGTLAGKIQIARRRLEPRPAAPRLIEPRRVELRPVEPTLIEPKRVEPKPVEPTLIEPKRVEPKPVEPTLIEPKRIARLPRRPETTIQVAREPYVPREPYQPRPRPMSRVGLFLMIFAFGGAFGYGFSWILSHRLNIQVTLRVRDAAPQVSRIPSQTPAQPLPSSATAAPVPTVEQKPVPGSPRLVDPSLQERYKAARQLISEGRFREAQDEYLGILLYQSNPDDDVAMEGLILARRGLTNEDPAALRRQAASYLQAATNGEVTSEGYTRTAMEVLARASLAAARKIEAERLRQP